MHIILPFLHIPLFNVDCRVESRVFASARMAGLCAALLCYMVGGAWAGLQAEVFLARQVERADWEAARLDTRQVDTEVECGGACLSSRQCVGFSVQATESNRKFYQPIDCQIFQSRFSTKTQ